MRIINQYLYEFKKSIVIIMINFFISLLITMAVSSIVCGYEYAQTPPNGLGTSQVSFVLRASLNDRISDIIGAIEANTDRFVLSYSENSGFIGMYIKDFETELNMLEGRFINNNDYLTNSAVAVVASDFKDNCIRRGKDLYYAYGGINYKIIGIYERNQNFINPTASFIYALSEEYCNNAPVPGEGVVTWTFASHDEPLPKSFENKYRIKIIEDMSDSSFVNALKKIAEAMGGTLLGAALVVSMILLNMFNIISEWLFKHRKEIRISLICGGNKKKIFGHMLSKYLSVILTSGLISIIMAFLVIKTFKHTFVNFNISPQTFLISLGILIAISGGICSIEINKYFKNGISDILRR